MVGRAGCCFGGQSFNPLVCGLNKTLIKSLIRLSADAWGWVPSLLVVSPEVTQHWSLPGFLVGLMVDSGRAHAKEYLPELLEFSRLK